MQDSDYKKFIIELYDALSNETQKYLSRHTKKKHDPVTVLGAMQNVAVNYLAQITQTISDPLEDVVEKLDYIESVRAHTNEILDHLKTKAKAVLLN